MTTVVGKYGIKARVVLHSITQSGINLITFENEKPRLILSEENTHRMLSKNSASSRAIPFAKMQQQLTARPVRFGEANPGMQDKGEDFDVPVVIPTGLYHSLAYMLAGKGLTIAEVTFTHGEVTISPELAWEFSKWLASNMSESFYKAKYHKQVYNRVTEPYQMMKTVISGTEWANFFWLRDDHAADPTIAELARVMREAKDASEPFLLYPGEWHLPYVGRYRDDNGWLHYGDDVEVEGHIVDVIEYSLPDAIKVSAARCAAVSFRNVDYGLEKSREVHERLVGDERKHASALEHQATPMKLESIDADYLGTEYDDSVNVVDVPSTWEGGISHMDRDGNLWSGNFKGWIQYRKLIAGENYVGEF